MISTDIHGKIALFILRKKRGLSQLFIEATHFLLGRMHDRKNIFLTTLTCQMYGRQPSFFCQLRSYIAMTGHD